MSPIRVLLVDDHPLLREGVKLMLGEEKDIEVVGEADSGEVAIQLVQEVAPDVVVMDITLPDLGGAEATRRILTTQPLLRVLALSGHDDLESARLMLDAGALGYVLKRSAGREMLRALRTVAVGGTYVDATLSGATSLSVSPTARRPNRVSTLSERETEVVRLTANGYTAKEMARVLGVSPRTLETYKARAMTKLNLRSRTDLVRYALRSGWLSDGCAPGPERAQRGARPTRSRSSNSTSGATGLTRW